MSFGWNVQVSAVDVRCPYLLLSLEFSMNLIVVNKVFRVASASFSVNVFVFSTARLVSKRKSQPVLIYRIVFQCR